MGEPPKLGLGVFQLPAAGLGSTAGFPGELAPGTAQSFGNLSPTAVWENSPGPRPGLVVPSSPSNHVDVVAKQQTSRHSEVECVPSLWSVLDLAYVLPKGV